MFATLTRSAALVLIAGAATAQQAPEPASGAPTTAEATAGVTSGSAAPTPAATATSGAPRVGITKDMAQAVFKTPEGEFTVSRDQTPGARLEGDWALTGPDCPPFCI